MCLPDGEVTLHAPGKRVRIATFNLENLSGAPGASVDFGDRCRILRPQLVRMAADILCLQEVGAERVGPKGTPREFQALSTLLEGTGYEDYQLVNSLLKDGRGPADVHNLIILSRYPIIRHRQFWNELVSPPAYRYTTSDPVTTAPETISWDRPALYAEIDVGSGRNLHVFNLHLRAPLASFVPGQKIGPFKWRTVSGWAEGFYVASIKRSGQALEVRFAIEGIFDTQPDALITVCGDMNADLPEMPLRILRGGEEDTENPKLGCREMIALENTAPESRRYSVIHGGRPVMLDHMLASRALFSRFESVDIHNDVLNDELLDYQRGEHLAESHHAPIIVSFDLAKAAGRQDAKSKPTLTSSC